MPFTLAHPAAVMPLRRMRFLEPLALVIGSVLPDVPYFLPGFLHYRFEYTHTLRGSLVEDLPVGVIILLGVLLTRRILVALLSERARWVFLGVAQRFTARPINWLLAAPSLLIGCWTHIAWDSFTHENAWAARRFPLLNASIPMFGLINIQVYHLLQYASSVLGLIVLVYWYRELARAAPRELPVAPVPLSTRVALLALVVIAAVAIGSVQSLHTHVGSFYRLAYLLLTRCMAWFGLAYFIVGAFVALAERFLAGREPPEPAAVRSESP
jgi:hypothetical protein